MPAGSFGKTVEGHTSGGSPQDALQNPSLSAKQKESSRLGAFFLLLMSYYTYILKSQKDFGYYYGHCSVLEERLLRHNKGRVRSTKSRLPFVLHYFEVYETKSEAYRRELFFKSAEGKKHLKDLNIIG